MITNRQEAVSESIGFIIILGLVLSGIGLITLYGYPMLMQQESNANMRNMEQTLMVLQNDMKSLAYKLEHYKETSIQVGGGSLGVYPLTVQTFTISQPGSCQYVFNPGELRYVSTRDNAAITLENGAVIKKQYGINGSVALSKPRWYQDNQKGVATMVINLVYITSRENQINSMTGSGVVGTRYDPTAPVTVCQGGSPGIITITYTPDIVNQTTDGYDQAWKDIMEDPDILGMICSENEAGKVLICISGAAEYLVVKKYDIQVNL